MIFAVLRKCSSSCYCRQNHSLHPIVRHSTTLLAKLYMTSFLLSVYFRQINHVLASALLPICYCRCAETATFVFLAKISSQKLRSPCPFCYRTGVFASSPFSKPFWPLEVHMCRNSRKTTSNVKSDSDVTSTSPFSYRPYGETFSKLEHYFMYF